MQTASNLGFWRVLLPLILAEMTCALESNMLYSALPTFQRTFHDSVGAGWLITAFLLMSGAASAMCGRLGDLFGRTRVLMLMLGTAMAGSVMSALAPSLEWVIAGRALQGGLHGHPAIVLRHTARKLGAGKGPFACGCAWRNVYSRLRIWLWGGRCRRRSSFMAVALLVERIARRAGPHGGGHLRASFVRSCRGVLFVPAVAMVLLSISNSRSWGWGNIRTLSLGLGGALLLAVWVWQETRIQDPLINVRLFLNRRIALGNVGLALGSIGGFQVVLVAMLFIQQPAWTGTGLGDTAQLRR